jgi:carbon-monoxide dehydrogenase large subunit
MNRAKTWEAIGRSPARLDAYEKVTGRALFAVDMKLVGMLHAKVLRSPIPHGRISHIDVSEAETLPGVITIVTGKDFPGSFGATVQDQNFLAREKVRFVGDPVAAVAAADLDAAEEALGRIKVEYETLAAIFDPVEAMQAGSVLIHEELSQYPTAPGIFSVAGTNICNYFKLRKGDTERGFTESHVVLEDSYTTQMVQHVHLEPHASIAQVDPSGKILVWSNTQTPYFNRRGLARALNLPLNKVRIMGTAVGGGARRGQVDPSAVDPGTGRGSAGDGCRDGPL